MAEITYLEEELYKAKPCPNCGSRDIEWDTFGKDEYYIACITCGVSGPTLNNSSIEQAVEAWNKLPRYVKNTHE